MNPQDVPAGPLLLDTDVFSYLLAKKGPYEAFERLVDGHPFVISFATVGELRAGAFRAAWGEARTSVLEQRIHSCVVVNPTNDISTRYGRLHALFRDQLKKDGSNDMWTAACSLSQSPPLPVATNNLNDFQLMASKFPFPIVHPDL